MKSFILLSLLTISLYSDKIEINNFESDLFSNDRQTLRKIEASFSFEGRDLRVNKIKVIDSLNIIISSFFIEDLLTSKGKEKFKELLTQYTTSRHSVDLDEIYIKKMRIKNPPTDIKAIIKALEKEGFRKQNKSITISPSPVQKVFESTPSPISSTIQTTTTVPPIIETYETTPSSAPPIIETYETTPSSAPPIIETYETTPSSVSQSYDNVAPKRTWK
jgi:hypothetical protein